MKLENKKIKSILEGVLNYDLLQEDDLLTDGVLDSLTTIMVIEELENSFSIVITPEDFTHFNFNSLENISNMVQRIID